MRDALVRVGGFAVLAGVAVLGYTVFRIWSQGEIDERRPADAIVVLGAAQFDGHPSPVFAARLDHAVALYHEGLAPILVVTGGKAVGDRTTEAAVARAYAVARGVPGSAILAEDRGRTTLESLEAVGAIFRAHALHSAVFVSDRSHMLRVLRMASDQGITAWGSPTTTSPVEQELGREVRAFAHEVGALIEYYVGGGRLLSDDPTVGISP
jgi:uncharacterized SAM-binding protein YcdF (DUF218 family)